MTLGFYKFKRTVRHLTKDEASKWMNGYLQFRGLRIVDNYEIVQKTTLPWVKA